MEKDKFSSGSSENGGGIDFGILTDKQLVDFLADPNSTNEERQGALDTINAREQYGVFDPYGREDESSNEEEEDSLATEEDNGARRIKINHVQKEYNPELDKKAVREQKTTAAATVRTYRPIDEVSPQELQNNIEAEVLGALYSEKIDRENEALANKIKNELLSSNKAMRAYKKSGPDYLADGKLEMGPARVLADGYDELFGDELDKQINEKGEERKFHRARLIEDLAAEKYIDAAGEDGANRLKRATLAAATRLGATLEPELDSDGLMVKYALPIETRGDGDLQDYMEKSGFDRKGTEVRQESYEGFCNILDLIKDFEEPDLKGLNWYYENFGYSDNVDEFFEIVNGRLEEGSKSKEIFDNFWFSKLESDKDKIDDAPVMDVDSMLEINGKDLSVDNVEDFEKFLKSIRFIDRLFPKGHGDARGKYNRAEDLRNGDIREINKGVTGIMYTYWYIKDNIDENLELYIPRDIIGENGNINRSTQNYMAIRFGCNGKNNVIAEPCGNIGATYLWSGRSEFGEADGWKEIFKIGRLELKRMIKDGDEKVVGTSCKSHRRKKHGSVEAESEGLHMANMLKILNAYDEEKYRSEEKKVDSMCTYMLTRERARAEALTNKKSA